MAKKKPAEEHENLERWLVSYADFMTLLFATFVVLYALAQSDVDAFKNMEEALRKAFSQNIFDMQANVMDGHDSILDGEDGATNPLMLEYMSQKYEQSSYEDVKENVENLKADGVNAEMTEKGLLIRLSDKAIKFKNGTAELEDGSKEILKEISRIIKTKFSIHYIEVEGHTDSDPLVNSTKYPSNWELSGARASVVVRYMITNSNFNPKLFSAVGLADTAPLVPNTSEANKAKNRRVEIIILKNKLRDLTKKDIQKIMKEVQSGNRNMVLKKIQSNNKHEYAGKDKELLNNVIDMSNQYSSETERLNSLDDKDFTFDGLKPDFMEKGNERK